MDKYFDNKQDSIKFVSGFMSKYSKFAFTKKNSQLALLYIVKIKFSEIRINISYNQARWNNIYLVFKDINADTLISIEIRNGRLNRSNVYSDIDTFSSLTPTTLIININYHGLI